MLTFNDNLDCYKQNNNGYRKLNSNTFHISNTTYNIEPNSINYVDTSEGEIRLYINYLLLKPSDIIIVVDIGNNLHLEKISILNLKRLNNEIVSDFDLTISTSIYRFYYISEEYGWAYENIILNSLYGNINIHVDWNDISNKPTSILNTNILDVYTKDQTDLRITWENLLNKPTSIIDYDIDDVYTKSEIDALLEDLNGGGSTTISWSNITNKPTSIIEFNLSDVYTKSQIDTLIENIELGEITWNDIINKPTTLDGFNITDVYTKTEVNNLISDITAGSISWANITAKPNTISTFGITDAYTKTEVYTKPQIDALIDAIDGGGTAVYWNTILSKPDSISGFGILDAVSKTELTTALINYSPKEHTHTNYALTSALANYSLKEHTHTNYVLTSALANYALKAHTHTFASLTEKPNTISGYGINDVYTKTQIDAALVSKLNITSYNATDILTKIKTVDGPNSGLNADLLDGIQGNAYQLALGFTPVQQGGGIGQLTNKIKIGWSGTKLKATVDSRDLGEFVFSTGDDNVSVIKSIQRGIVGANKTEVNTVVNITSVNKSKSVIIKDSKILTGIGSYYISTSPPVVGYYHVASPTPVCYFNSSTSTSLIITAPHDVVSWQVIEYY